MRADDLNSRDFQKVMAALVYFHDRPQSEDYSNSAKDIKAFFDDNKELDYSEFLKLYNDKYGSLIENHNRHIHTSKMKSINGWLVVIGLIAITSVILSIFGLVTFSNMADSLKDIYYRS